MALAGLCVMGLALGACGDDENPEDGNIIGLESPTLVVSPPSLDFDQISIGSENQKTLTITNTGRGELKITSLQMIENNEDNIVEFHKEGAWAVKTLGFNQSMELVVSYRPENQTPDSGVIRIISNDPRPGFGQFDVPLRTPQLEPEIFSPETVVFNRVAPGQTEWQVTRVHNIGHASLTFEDVAFSGSADFAISFPTLVDDPPIADDSQSWPTVLAPDNSFPMRVTFSPQDDEPAKAEVVFYTNDPNKPTYKVLLSGNSGSPCMAITDENGIDFSLSSIGQTSNRTITIENCSRTAELRVSAIEISNDGGGVFELRPESLPGGLPDEAAVITARDSANFVLTYTPIDESASTGELLLRSNDPAKTTLRVPILGKGSFTVCPIAVAEGRVTTSGGSYRQEISARPLQHIEFSGLQSTDPDGTALRYEWSVVSRPQGSQSNLSPNNSIVDPRLYLDIAGTYEVELVVYDATGLASCQSSIVTIYVIPGDEIHIQLVWDAPAVPRPQQGHGTDLDLHYLHPLGRWNATNNNYDVFWQNRQANWGTQASPSIASLDIDDVYGVGPENVNHKNPVSGLNYSVGVFYFHDNGFGPADATVRIYVHGQLAMEIRDRRLPGTGYFWNVAAIQWPSGNIVQRNSISFNFP
ncbi:MAG: choice-of-anchor D domain-containing protein [Bradymonadaceae bacterium]|nr:choice-of-anchor D domain-containing protein [Lujinxingiaceae bacterium]